jgi:hypothetical protein
VVGGVALWGGGGRRKSYSVVMWKREGKGQPTGQRIR